VLGAVVGQSFMRMLAKIGRLRQFSPGAFGWTSSFRPKGACRILWMGERCPGLSAVVQRYRPLLVGWGHEGGRDVMKVAPHFSVGSRIIA
jgi:hypothetical protein